MKLGELKRILYSCRGAIQSAIVWDKENCKELEKGCSVEYAVENYGNYEVKHITADQGYLVITI